MATWGDIERDHPEYAERVRARFDAYKHKVIATLRKDGSPRISGIEMEFKDGQVVLGMMPNSLKARDLQRDPRLALHSGTEDPVEAPGSVIDAKLSGRAIEMPGEDHHVFYVDIEEMVLIAIGDLSDHLLIETWRAGRGLKPVKRY